MPKGKVESVSFVDSWKDGSRHNFTVKFEGMGKDDRIIFSWKDKEQPMLKVGDETEYNITGRSVSFYLNGKKYEYPQAELPKNKQSFGGGGGNKTYVKTPEQYKNELLGYIGGYAKDIIAHRVNLGKDAEDIIVVYEKLVDGMFKALSKHIQ